MSREERWLPLFLLSTVLFPSASLPLQIFEERYKLMLEHCLGSDSKFGVVLIKSGSEVGEPAIPYSTGTVAQILHVNRIEGGRILVAVVGERRFRIKNIAQYRPYMAAQVELLDEDAGAAVSPQQMNAFRQAISEYSRLAQGLRGGWASEARMPSDQVMLSYFVAQMLLVDLAARQALLEQPSASLRLEAALKLMQQGVRPLKQRVAEELRGRFSTQ